MSGGAGGLPDRARGDIVGGSGGRARPDFGTREGTAMKLPGRITAALGIAAASLLGPASAAPRDAAHNWIREYVELRRQARLERAVGAQATAELRGVAEPKIVGGTLTPKNVHRFQVALLFKGEPNNFLAQYCGGTLIRPNVVVTAAHCSDFVGRNDVQVLTGTHSLDGTGVRRNVSRIVIHPDWDPETFDSDLAIWLLSSSARGVPVARLIHPDDEPATGTSTLVTGWGDVVEGGFYYQMELRHVEVSVLSRRNCNDANSYDGDITATMFCAGTFAGGKDSCQGDSGGPLTIKRDGKYTVLAGVTSWGTGCARPDLPGVYTRLTKFRGWILWTVTLLT
jgi:secreted trypsin-like serine protease